MLTRWAPLLAGEWGQLQGAVNRLFDDFLGRTDGPGLAVSYPPVNVWEDADRVYAEAELPGMELDRLEIFVTEGDQLTVRGERQPPRTQEGNWHRLERGFGKFSRTLQLPAHVEADRVEARFENGVLRLTMPKAAHARPRRIPVKAE